MKVFDKIIGYETVKNELYQIIDMFKNKDIYKKMGADLPHGLLIFGRPGIGKSLLAEALIEESNVNSFVLKKNKDTKEFIDDIKAVFEEAKEKAPSIVNLDDIDKFSESNGNDVDDSVFAVVQACIDSVKNDDVLVIATANNQRKLPNSLMRAGRFDRKINLQPPTSEDARKIIEYYLKSKNVNKNINYEDISKMISYHSCAALESLLNESAIYAAYQRKDSIDIDDIIKAYLRDQLDSPDENYKCSKEELEITSLHEAGHSCIAEILKEGSVGFISVQATGRDNIDGFTHMCEDFRRRPENILIALGGKAAVELFYGGRCASGCQSDIARAAELIRDGLMESGTCGVGMINVSDDCSQSFNARNESVAQAELERYLFIARDILIKNKDFLLKLTEKLSEKHTLLYSEIRKIRNSVKINEYVLN